MYKITQFVEQIAEVYLFSFKMSSISPNIYPCDY